MSSVLIEQRLKIGQVASATGLPVKTIRYYEEIGLLEPTVLRSQTGYRLFNSSVLNRLAFVRRAQALGLTLMEIKDVLSVHDQGLLPCGEVKQHLQAKVKEIDQKIDELLLLRSELEGILSGWEENPSQAKLFQTICPNIYFEQRRK